LALPHCAKGKAKAARKRMGKSAARGITKAGI
jgi:hypothetical protein